MFLDEADRCPARRPTEPLGDVRDLNGDGLPDLVCNDFVYWPDRVWLNRRANAFAARCGFRCSACLPWPWMWRISRDGFDDIFVATC